MQIGKIPETVLKRSVIKKIKVRRPEVLVHAGVGEDCAVLGPTEDAIVLSTDPITGTSKDIGKLAFHITANDIASSGAELVGMLVTVIFPPESQEEELQIIMEELTALAEKYEVEILGGHTEVSAAVNQTLISVTGVGKAAQGKIVTTGGLRAGQALVVTKWIGLEGSSILAKEKEELLQKQLPNEIIETAKRFDEKLSVVPDSKVAMEIGASAMHDVTEGGIFGALWEMAAASGVGLTVDLKKIPLRQETIEICEVFDINPYMLISSGSLLIGTNPGY